MMSASVASRSRTRANPSGRSRSIPTQKRRPIMFDVLGQFLHNPNHAHVLEPLPSDRVQRISNLAAQYEGCDAMELYGIADDELRSGYSRRNGEIARAV